jgi:tetratricopeptide (TPR) repeat protein
VVCSSWRLSYQAKTTVLCLVFSQIKALWDFGNPDLSQQRFQEALKTASPDAALILHSQIARVYGLKHEFEAARAYLQTHAVRLSNASPEAQVCFYLENGRTYASAKHSQEQRNPAQARANFEKALLLAKAAHLDALAVDTLHMLAMLETEPLEELKVNQAALELVINSVQADAKYWEASLRNNIGMNLHQLGQLEAALLEFEQAVVLRQAENNPNPRRIAEWMVAWTLRGLLRHQEALQIQLRLEQEFAAINQPDPYVFEELELLHLALGDANTARLYAKKNNRADVHHAVVDFTA